VRFWRITSPKIENLYLGLMLSDTNISKIV